MRALLQRVSEASVSVEGAVVAHIGPGLCALVGARVGDTAAAAERLAAKIWQLRVFADEQGNMNRSAAELGLAVLVVSQFTLYADTSRGRRPSFALAAPPAEAKMLVDLVADCLASSGAKVATGRFGATMQLSLVNEGPVTLMVET